MYAFLANLVVAVHVAYVGFVVVGQLAIVCGVVCRWRWIRNLWFRQAHLGAIVLVALESVCNIPCPLTIWENRFRSLAGQESFEGAFIGHWLHALIFYDFPTWVFTTLYITFAALVAITFLAAPPRWRGAAPLEVRDLAQSEQS